MHVPPLPGFVSGADGGVVPSVTTVTGAAADPGTATGAGGGRGEWSLTREVRVEMVLDEDYNQVKDNPLSQTL